MMNDTTPKQIAAVKAMVNKGNHIWTWNHIWRPSSSWLYLRGAFGQKSVINFATLAGLGGRNTTELLLAINEERLLPAPYYRPAKSNLQMTGRGRAYCLKAVCDLRTNSEQ